MIPLRTVSGRPSATILIHLVLGIAGQALALFGWLQGVLSAEAWGIAAGILATVQSIAAMYQRLLAGQTAGDGTKGEPLKRAARVGLVLLFSLLWAACGTLHVEALPGDEVFYDIKPDAPHEIIYRLNGEVKCRAHGPQSAGLRADPGKCWLAGPDGLLQVAPGGCTPKAATR